MYIYVPDHTRIWKVRVGSGPYVYFFKIPIRSDRTRTVGLYAYGLPSFTRLSRFQKYFTDQRYSNLKYIKKTLIIAVVQFRNKYNLIYYKLTCLEFSMFVISEFCSLAVNKIV